MDITYLGHSSFKIKGKVTTVITDPYDSDMVGLKFPKTDGDIITVSHNHSDHNKVEAVANVKKVISGPGEYEISGVSIIGVQSFHDDKKGKERGPNTLYVIEIDGVRILHSGDLGHKLGDSDIKEIGTIDILMIPVGGKFTLGPKEAMEVVKQVGPSIIIPMHYKAEGMNTEAFGELGGIDDFLKESNMRVEKLPKLSVKEGGFKEDEEYIVVLEKK